MSSKGLPHNISGLFVTKQFMWLTLRGYHMIAVEANKNINI